MKTVILILIKIYQKTLSFDHGMFKFLKPYGQCRFYPTCSEYTYQAVAKYGSLKGMWLGLKRIIRCHPWTEGGYDPIEKNKNF